MLTAARRIRQATLLVVLTGAGVSKESGVPTFRDALEGLWASYDPSQLATPQAFQRDPRLVWDWYEQRRHRLADVRPNPGHKAIVALEHITRTVVITQNVDGLHQLAGSSDVIELHGNIRTHKCFDDCQGAPTLVDITALHVDPDSGPPRCPHCGGLVRPNVVWFNEVLPVRALDRARQLSSQCTVMLVVGTSGLVQPAASLPLIAARAGAFVIDVNPNRDEIAPLADVFLQGASGSVLPRLLAAIRELPAD
jgi:NAD-dependent deacetylase